MGHDLKYGRVTLEHGNIAKDEPVFVLRAQDQLAIDILHFYESLCQQAGSPPHHLLRLAQVEAQFAAWQADHFTQIPQSAPPS